VTRPARFESYRYLGDKRTQTVYDLDLADDAGLEDVIDELMRSEARNRGYRPHRSIRAAEGPEGGIS
jgi:hypothetical protein